MKPIKHKIYCNVAAIFNDVDDEIKIYMADDLFNNLHQNNYVRNFMSLTRGIKDDLISYCERKLSKS